MLNWSDSQEGELWCLQKHGDGAGDCILVVAWKSHFQSEGCTPVVVG